MSKCHIVGNLMSLLNNAAAKILILLLIDQGCYCSAWALSEMTLPVLIALHARFCVIC